MFYSEKIASVILDIKDIPNDVKQRAKELMLDSIGTALAASKQKSVLRAFDAFKDMSCDSSKKEKLWIKDEELESSMAAMLNAFASHALDYDDTHTEAILHASAILTPLCLTWGFSVCNDGNKILKAFILGWEVGAKIGIASKGTFHKRGFHTTSLCGTYAATVASAILLDLNKEELINALGIAASFACGINEFLSNGSNSKLLHIANALRNGIFIAKLAKAKLSGPLTVFEGRDNFFRVFGIEEDCDKESLVKDLCKDYAVMQVSIKPYPCCHFAHGLIDCALELRNEGFKDEDIKSIKCFVDEVPISFICDPLDKKYNPNTAYEAKFSMPFLFALAFKDGFISLQSLENLDRKDIKEFAKKISYEKRKSSGFPKYFPGHLEAILKDGKIIKKDVFINKGNFDNPLSFEELKEKFLSNAKISISEAKALELIKQIENLENLKTFTI